MSAETKASVVLVTLAVVFLGLAAAFRFEWWGAVATLETLLPTPKVFTNTTTVRLSAAELMASDGDTSGMDCYGCHERKKVPKVHQDAEGNVILPSSHRDLILARSNCAACHEGGEKMEVKYDNDGNALIPKEHEDLVLAHGRNKRNNDCFNCHDPAKLDQLQTRDGRKLKFEQATELCGSCHGPSYRDWELGIHGRTSGYWDRSQGPSVRKGCTSCHDPHSPAFPRMIPGPRPNLLHPLAHAEGEAKGGH